MRRRHLFRLFTGGMLFLLLLGLLAYWVDHLMFSVPPRPLFHNVFRTDKPEFGFGWSAARPISDRFGNAAYTDYELNLVVLIARDVPLPPGRHIPKDASPEGATFLKETKDEIRINRMQNALILCKDGEQIGVFPLAAGMALMWQNDLAFAYRHRKNDLPNLFLEILNRYEGSESKKFRELVTGLMNEQQKLAD